MTVKGKVFDDITDIMMCVGLRAEFELTSSTLKKVFLRRRSSSNLFFLKEFNPQKITAAQYHKYKQNQVTCASL
jgi:hypothetical protein